MSGPGSARQDRAILCACFAHRSAFVSSHRRPQIGVRCDVSDEAWGSAKWVLEGSAEPLAGQRRKVVGAASGAYSAAVEASLEASLEPEQAADLTVGRYLREAWPEVGCSVFG